LPQAAQANSTIAVLSIAGLLFCCSFCAVAYLRTKAKKKHLEDDDNAMSVCNSDVEGGKGLVWSDDDECVLVLGDEGTIVLRVQPGDIGAARDPATGRIISLIAGGQLDSLDVKAGWQMLKVNDSDYSPILQMAHENGTESYTITFKKGPRKKTAMKTVRINAADLARGDKRSMTSASKYTNQTVGATPRRLRRGREQSWGLSLFFARRSHETEPENTVVEGEVAPGAVEVQMQFGGPQQLTHAAESMQVRPNNQRPVDRPKSPRANPVDKADSTKSGVSATSTIPL
jgi:hypothetical protein